MDDPLPLRFTSIDFERLPLRGDRAVVLCDRDRPEGLAFLIGRTVDIDGALYDVVQAEAPRLYGPLKRGEHVVLMVRPHFEARMPNTNQTGRA